MSDMQAGIQSKWIKFIFKGSSNPANAILIVLGISDVFCLLFSFINGNAFYIFGIITFGIILLLAWAFIFKPENLRDTKAIIELKKLEHSFIGDKKTGILEETPETEAFQPIAKLSEPENKVVLKTLKEP